MPDLELRALLQEHLPDLYRFAYLMTASRDGAAGQLRFLVNEAADRGAAALAAAPDVRTELIAMLARGIEHRLSRRADYTFDGLDQTLRSDITRPIDLTSGALAGDPARLNVMLWELKRTCLGASLCSLATGIRMSIVLTDLFGYEPDVAARMLEINPSAYRVRITRGRKRLGDYLAPRCAHMDPDNPCTCTGRLSIAMDAGFVSYPADTADVPHAPHDAGNRHRNATDLLRSLPPVLLPQAQAQALLAHL